MGKSEIFDAEARCRRCGVVYQDGCHTGLRSTVDETMLELLAPGHKSRHALAPGLYASHNCEDGGVGLSDFIGWRKAK